MQMFMAWISYYKQCFQWCNYISMTEVLFGTKVRTCIVIQWIFNSDQIFRLWTTRLLIPSRKKQGKSEGFDSCDRPSNLAQIFKLVNSNWSYSTETPNLGQIRRCLEPCDLEIWRMTLQNNRAPLLCYFKLCASFHTHWWIQIWVTVRKRSFRVKSDDFFSLVT